MQYDTSISSELKALQFRYNFLIENKKVVDLKTVNKTRTSQQNKAIHKFFMIMSEQLNELGIEYLYHGPTGKEISLMYTPELVKMFFWKPIQNALFDFESTTKLTTLQMNQIIDVIVKFFGDKGVLIEFPNVEHKDL